MALSEEQARDLLVENGQEHILRFWDRLDEGGRQSLSDEVGAVDFPLINRLINEWILHEPRPESFSDIKPVPVIPYADSCRSDTREALAAGEEALLAGRVGLLMVAGGQGTRLGFDGPKGAYPIGPISGKSLFAFHSEKIHNLQRRYGCTLPWHIMVSDATESATKRFFNENGFFGLHEDNVRFFRQRMMPCVDEEGKFILERPDRLAMNPNGHGGCIPGVVEAGITSQARERGIDILTYFQVDNWAVKIADPAFIGHHLLREAEISSKVHRKNEAREHVGVHCLCDDNPRVIEYTELDLYPELLEMDNAGRLTFFAGNTAIHTLSIDFIERVYDEYDRFPWHCAHKKIRCIDEDGVPVEPCAPNGYKFETFIFDAVQFIRHEPVALEIPRAGEYTPIKQYKGVNSVLAARQAMRAYWAEWLEAAGWPVPRGDDGDIAVEVEISPQFALSKDEFLERVAGKPCPQSGDIGIGPDGTLLAVAGAG